ncbi:MAG: hypothetical protein H0V17_27260 [Deltaproteobacteria bacterium]|nr:hypothetical protein [Deltaproteobacteria bacterium]
MKVKIGPPPIKLTKGVLTGATCDDNACKCREGADDGGVGLPTDGRKRFEIRLESAYDLWVTLPDTVLYKSPETAIACFYVDLAPGKHPLAMRASNPAGVSFALEVHELGTDTKSWYDTFEFKCGHPGVCTFDELDGKSESKTKRGLHDACGSVKVKNVAWDHGKSPDMQVPSELAMELKLDVYKFAPWKPRGDTSCGEGGGRGPKGEKTFADETATP